MAKIFVNDLIKGATGKICSHSDIYYSMNKSSNIVHTGKMCHPFEGAASAAQLAQQTAFATRVGYAKTWLNANKPSDSNPNGTADYKLAQSLKKQLGYSSIIQVVHKYMNASGTVTLPSGTPGGSSANTYTVTLTASPAAGGNVTGGGSNIAAGSSVNISAVANSGYSFTKWSDNNTSASRTLTVNDNVTLQAIFTLQGGGMDE